MRSYLVSKTNAVVFPQVVKEIESPFVRQRFKAALTELLASRGTRDGEGVKAASSGWTIGGQCGSVIAFALCTTVTAYNHPPPPQHHLMM